MTPNQFTDVDLCGNILILAQAADFDPPLTAKRVDGSKIVCTYAVRRRAKGGKRPHATIKKRRSVRTVDDFAVQLDRDASGVRLAFGPSAVIRRNFADGADQTRGSMHDGDEMTYRLILLARLQRTADNALRAI